MSEFQRFVNQLSETKKQHPAHNSSHLPPRKFPKQQYQKFNHRLEISLLIILALGGSGTALSYHWQAYQHTQATAQYHRPKHSNVHKSSRTVKIHHHINHKHETKQHASQMTRLNQSQPSISLNKPIVNTSSSYEYSETNQIPKTNNSSQKPKLAQDHFNGRLQKFHKEPKAISKKSQPINKRN